MLSAPLHRIAGHPWVYDLIQRLAGSRQVDKRVSVALASLNPKNVVDIGGGTGAVRGLLARDCRYVCLDMEMPKLAGFRARVPNGLAVLGDATKIPLTSGCADLVVCKAVTHHLTESQLEQSLDESCRVLKQRGRFLLLDAIWNTTRIAGRVLWSLDRGSYPRTEEDLRSRMASKFEIEHWEKFAIYHEYVFGIGVRR
jgi:ubiquinone/menaquinone biosynthesis C-methylase UbiE